MNIQTYVKYMHQNTTETKAFLLDYVSTLLKRFDDLCLTKYRAAFTHGIEGIAENWFASSNFWIILK